MSRRVSSFAGTITLFVAFLAAFASASPADVPRGDLGVERRNNEVEGVPSQPDTTDTINDFSATVYKGDVQCSALHRSYTNTSLYLHLAGHLVCARSRRMRHT